MHLFPALTSRAVTRITLPKIGSVVLVAATTFLTLAAFQTPADAGGPLGGDPRGTLVDGVLALLIGWLLTRSFSTERSTRQALTDHREYVAKALAELEKDQTERITQGRLEIASVRGQLLEIDKRLDAQRASLETVEDRRDGDREAERAARHALANQTQSITADLEGRLHELAERLTAVETQIDRRRKS